ASVDLDAAREARDRVTRLDYAERAAARRDGEDVARTDVVVVEGVRERDLVHVDAVLPGDARQRVAGLHRVVRDLGDVIRGDGHGAARSCDETARCRRDTRRGVLARVRGDLRGDDRLIVRRRQL